MTVTAVRKDIPPPALQRLLGHDRLATTEIYLNLSPEDVVREFRDKWSTSMCGRYTFQPTEEFYKRFHIANRLDGLVARYNIAPGQLVQVIISQSLNHSYASAAAKGCCKSKPVFRSTVKPEFLRAIKTSPR
jgi:hypothetical protein